MYSINQNQLEYTLIKQQQPQLYELLLNTTMIIARVSLINLLDNGIP